jgi:hypothetical protein
MYTFSPPGGLIEGPIYVTGLKAVGGAGAVVELVNPQNGERITSIALPPVYTNEGYIGRFDDPMFETRRAVHGVEVRLDDRVKSATVRVRPFEPHEMPAPARSAPPRHTADDGLQVRMSARAVFDFLGKSPPDLVTRADLGATRRTLAIIMAG